MKKQEVIDVMRKTAVAAHLINKNPIGDSYDRDVLFGELIALRGIAARLFYGEDINKEFEFYLDNYDKPFPQPQN